MRGILLGWVLIFTVNAIELTFELPDNAVQCFYEDIKSGVDNILEFQVVTGGQYDVDMTLEDPSGKVLYKDIKKQYDSFNWKAEVPGTYKACFSNEFSTFSHKIVYMDWQVGDVNNYGRAVTPGTHAMSSLESSSVSIGDKLRVVDDYQTHHRLREATGRKRAEQLNERVLLWSLGQTAVIVLIGIAQPWSPNTIFPRLVLHHRLKCKMSLHELEAGRTPFFDLTRYNDFPQFEDYVRGVAQMNPDFVDLKLIGWSREHRPLVGLKIGKRTNHTKPAVWFDGGNHAREWPAFHVSVYFIEQFVNKYKEDPQITKYVDLLDIYVFPVLNPDGFVFSRTSTASMIRQWRKNRAPTNCSGFTALQRNVCCEGVDLNRNYDIGFSQRNYPFNNPCSDEFQGPFPFSEPESRAVRDFITSKEIFGRLHALVSMHTHGQLWILPYNHHKKTYPEDFRDLELLASKAADVVYSYRETKYRIGTAADMLGTATGGATDWIKKNTPTKYVYVLELPPDMSTWFAFQIKPHWLLPIGRETWLGIKVIMDQVITETITASGRSNSHGRSV